MLEESDDSFIEPNDVLEQELPTADDFEQPQPKDEDEDKESYSKRVQKRIDKLAYERNIERTKREELERKLAAQEERIRALAEAHNAQAQERETQQIDNTLQDLKQRRRDALEIGDYDEVTAIDEKLIDIKVQSKIQPPQPQIATQQREAPQPQPNQTPQAMDQWLAVNEWARDPNQSARLDKADRIYQELVSKGYDPEEPDLYAELDKRLKRQSPPPSNGPDRGHVTGSDKGVFTAQDKRDMENWGLNPNDPVARKEWIKQKGVNYV